MFITRLISGIILLVITILFVTLGGDVLFASLIIISLIGMMELYRVIKVHNKMPGIVGYLVAIIYYGLLYKGKTEYLMMLVVLFMMTLLIIMVFRFPDYKIDNMTLVFFGLFYVTILLSYIYRVRTLPDGGVVVWLIFIGAWGSDTFAYCTGMLLGKHKLAPKLSPKKSIEGSVGGIIGAAILGFIFAIIFDNKITDVENPQLVFAIIGAASSIISQLGDLAASAIKRNYDFKDYGNLIPGHGGILDRFDSILFTAPIVYYLAVIV